MLQRLIDDIRQSTGSALRMTATAVAAMAAMFIATGFLCAAAFIAVMQKYGAIYACLAGAAVYGVLTFAAGVYLSRKPRARKGPPPAEKPKSPLQTALSDPMVLATGLQIVRSVGLKRLIPILAIGGVALGVMASKAGGERSDGEGDSD